jgi:hypothetical protein
MCPLGSSASVRPKTNLAGAYSDTWLSLLESRVWIWDIMSIPVLKCKAHVDVIFIYIKIHCSILCCPYKHMPHLILIHVIFSS